MAFVGTLAGCIFGVLVSLYSDILRGKIKSQLIFWMSLLSGICFLAFSYISMEPERMQNFIVEENIK